MRGRLVAVLSLLALAACQRPAEVATPPVPQAEPAYDEAERGNLFNLAFGASVVSRTAEMTLDLSAVRAIDGDTLSTWNSPPGDTNQTIVFSLPGPTRIEQIGAHTPAGRLYHVQKMKFESSVDGVTFTPLAEPQFAVRDEPQLFPITPVVASYVRVTTVDVPGRFAVLHSVQLRGALEGKVVAPPVTGCWTVNGEGARFEEIDGTVRGRIGDVELEGGADGALYRFVWTRGPEWGHAAITVAPDGKHLSGIKWHEEPTAYNFGTSWFGERCEKTGPAPSPRSLATLGMTVLHKAKRYPVYGTTAGINLAMQLLGEGKRIRLISRDYRNDRSAAEARANAFREELRKRGADLTRVDVRVAGSENPRNPIQTELMRSLYGVVEIEQ